MTGGFVTGESVAGGFVAGGEAPVVEARDLSKSFPVAGGEVPVLRGVSLSVPPGEFLAVVGPSGSGKSTLLYCLSGLEPLTSGSVSIMGRDVGGLRRGALAALRRDHVGFVFQAYNLIPSLTARENVALPARLAKRHVDAAGIDRALADVGLAERASYRPAALSGGQQQRVAIARVLALRPDVVFADEPTGALDTEAGGQVLDLLRGVVTGGRSVVMVTHDLQAAARADRVIVLRDGAVHRELRHPTTEDVFAAVAGEPVTGEPVADVPVTKVPVTDVPVTDVPVTEVPVTEVPVTDVPVS